MKLPILPTKKFVVPDCVTCAGFQCSPLSSCQSDEISLLSSGRQCQVYPKGSIIYRESSACSGIYCVHQGKVKVTKFSADGKEQIVRLGKVGDVLGVCSLLGDPSYTNSAIALDDSVVCFLPRHDVMALVQSNAQFAGAFMRLLSKAVNLADERMLNMAAKPVRERLADALLLLQRTFQEEGQQQFSISISREDLASLVGTVKETISRLVSEFKEDGIIAAKGSRITILQENKLLSISALYS